MQPSAICPLTAEQPLGSTDAPAPTDKTPARTQQQQQNERRIVMAAATYHLWERLYSTCPISFTADRLSAYFRQLSSPPMDNSRTTPAATVNMAAATPLELRVECCDRRNGGSIERGALLTAAVVTPPLTRKRSRASRDRLCDGRLFHDSDRTQCRGGRGKARSEDDDKGDSSCSVCAIKSKETSRPSLNVAEVSQQARDKISADALSSAPFQLPLNAEEVPVVECSERTEAELEARTSRGASPTARSPSSHGDAVIPHACPAAEHQQRRLPLDGSCEASMSHPAEIQDEAMGGEKADNDTLANDTPKGEEARYDQATHPSHRCESSTEPAHAPSSSPNVADSEWQLQSWQQRRRRRRHSQRAESVAADASHDQQSTSPPTPSLPLPWRPSNGYKLDGDDDRASEHDTRGFCNSSSGTRSAGFAHRVRQRLDNLTAATGTRTAVSPWSMYERSDGLCLTPSPRYGGETKEGLVLTPLPTGSPAYRTQSINEECDDGDGSGGGGADGLQVDNGGRIENSCFQMGNEEIAENSEGMGDDGEKTPGHPYLDTEETIVGEEDEQEDEGKMTAGDVEPQGIAVSGNASLSSINPLPRPPATVIATEAEAKPEMDRVEDLAAQSVSQDPHAQVESVTAITKESEDRHEPAEVIACEVEEEEWGKARTVITPLQAGLEAAGRDGADGRTINGGSRRDNYSHPRNSILPGESVASPKLALAAEARHVTALTSCRTHAAETSTTINASFHRAKGTMGTGFKADAIGGGGGEEDVQVVEEGEDKPYRNSMASSENDIVSVASESSLAPSRSYRGAFSAHENNCAAPLPQLPSSAVADNKGNNKGLANDDEIEKREVSDEMDTTSIDQRDRAAVSLAIEHKTFEWAREAEEVLSQQQRRLESVSAPSWRTAAALAEDSFASGVYSISNGGYGGRGVNGVTNSVGGSDFSLPRGVSLTPPPRAPSPAPQHHGHRTANRGAATSTSAKASGSRRAALDSTLNTAHIRDGGGSVSQGTSRQVASASPPPTAPTISAAERRCLRQWAAPALAERSRNDVRETCKDKVTPHPRSTTAAAVIRHSTDGTDENLAQSRQRSRRRRGREPATRRALTSAVLNASVTAHSRAVKAKHAQQETIGTSAGPVVRGAPAVTIRLWQQQKQRGAAAAAASASGMRNTHRSRPVGSDVAVSGVAESEFALPRTRSAAAAPTVAATTSAPATSRKANRTKPRL